MALDKQSGDRRSDPWASSAVNMLADLVAPDEPAAGSYFEAMVDRVALVGSRSRPCKACKGRCFRRVPQSVLDRYARRIAKASDPVHLATLREELRRASLCQTCGGSGIGSGESSASLCDACDATGEVNGQTCQACHGLRVVSLGGFDDFFTTTRCTRCSGTAEVLDEDAEDVCPLCLGKACTVPATVKETPCSKKGRLPRGALAADDVTAASSAGRHVGHDEVPDVADALRLRAQVQHEDPEAEAALRVYYGPQGDKWDATRWQRIFVLWLRTEAGKRILREAAARASASERGTGYHLRDPLEALAAVRAAEEVAAKPDFGLRSLFGQADAAARAMLSRARRTVERIGGEA